MTFSDLELSIHVLSQSFKTWLRIALTHKPPFVYKTDIIKLNHLQRDTIYPLHFILLHQGSLCRKSKIIGLGTYSIVYQREEYAFKCLRLVHRRDLRLAVKETLFLHTLRHPHIIKPLKTQFIMQHGEIVRVIHQLPLAKQTFSDVIVEDAETLWKYAKQFAAALHYVHTCGIIHGDLKPDNLLLMSNGNLMLADFSISILKKHVMYDTPLGSKPWSAPECALAQTTQASDIWSFGAIMVSFAIGTRALQTSDMKYNAEWAIVFDTPEDQKKWENILEKCLVFEPDKRATMQEVCTLLGVSHPIADQVLSGKLDVKRALDARRASYDSEHLQSLLQEAENFIWRSECDPKSGTLPSILYHLLMLADNVMT